MISEFVRKGHTYKTESVSDFIKDIHKTVSYNATKASDETRTKLQTEETGSTLTNNTKKAMLHEDFKTFLDVYETNLSNVIVIENNAQVSNFASASQEVPYFDRNYDADLNNREDGTCKPHVQSHILIVFNHVVYRLESAGGVPV